MSAITSGRCVHQARETATIVKTVKTEHDNGAVSYRTVADHQIEATVEIWIDFRSLLFQTASKAIRSRGKKSVLANGAIVITARDCKKLEL